MSSSLIGNNITTLATGGVVIVPVALPTQVSSLTCTPSSVTGSGAATCTATLNAPAPAGGTVVTLSDNSTFVTTPNSVTVGAGASTATFIASASAVTVNSTAILTARLNATSANASLSLFAQTVPSTLICAPASVAPGASTSCTVTLNQVAPAGGLLVSVSDNSNALSVPASVSVAAGNTMATFTATAGSASPPTAVTIIATANGTSKTALVTVTLSGPLTSLVCAPTAMSSGATATCTVTLSTATAARVYVMIADNSTALTVPSLVTMLAATRTATFTVRSGTITTPQTAVVTATLAGVSKTASLSLSSTTTACPCSVWKPSAVPATISESDTTPVELGMKFRSNIAGYAIGVRFYKGSQNTGTHTGKLWSKGGTLLASVTFSGETASGWQQANFSTPIAIAANTTYVISYWTWASHYSRDDRYFASSGVTNGPLYALRNGEDGSNGLYKYSSAGFPTSTWNSSNYWVDVVFNTVPSSNPTAASSDPSTLLTKESSMQRTASTMESTTASASSTPAPARSLYCAPKSVQAGDSFTCQLQLASDGASSIPVAASSSDVRLPATVQARTHQRLLTFHGIVDQAAPPSTFSVSVGDGSDLVEDQITVLPSLAPVLSLPETQIVKVGQSVSFKVSARDPSGLPVQISASKLPEGATFQQDSERFGWSPAPNQQGDHTIVFTALNSSGYSSERQIHIIIDSGLPVVHTAGAALCSPGTAATLEGRWLSLGGEDLSDLSGSSLELGGTKVRINGALAPVLFASQTRVDFLCPNAAPEARLDITLETPSGTTAPVQTTMLAARPRLLLAQDLNVKQALATIADTDRLAAVREYHGVGEPVQIDDVISLRATGLGIVDSFTGSIRVKVGGVDAQVESVVPSPNAAGVFLIQVRIPTTAPLGDEIPVRLDLLASDGQRHSSNVVTLAIE